MAYHMIAFLAIGLSVFAMVFALRHLSGGRVAKWLMPAAAGAAMLGWSIWSEYAWVRTTAAGLPDGMAVAWAGEDRIGYRPWTMVFPVASRLIAVDRRAPLRHEAQPGVAIMPVIFAARWQPTRTMNVAFDCEGHRRAEIGADTTFAADGALAGADWQPAEDADPIQTTACQGG